MSIEMKIPALFLTAFLALAQTRPAPQLEPLKMLEGKWTDGSSTVEFRYETGGATMLGRSKNEMLVIFIDPAGQSLRADSYGVGRPVIHYRQVATTGNSVVLSASGYRLTYEKGAPGVLDYRLESLRASGEPTVLSSGTLRAAGGSLIRPLSE